MPDRLFPDDEPKKKTPPRDRVFESLCTASGWDFRDLTAESRGRANKAAESLRKMANEADRGDAWLLVQIPLRAHMARLMGWTVTPNALAANWPTLVDPQQRKQDYEEASRARYIARARKYVSEMPEQDFNSAIAELRSHGYAVPFERGLAAVCTAIYRMRTRGVAFYDEGDD